MFCRCRVLVLMARSVSSGLLILGRIAGPARVRGPCLAPRSLHDQIERHTRHTPQTRIRSHPHHTLIHAVKTRDWQSMKGPRQW